MRVKCSSCWRSYWPAQDRTDLGTRPQSSREAVDAGGFPRLRAYIEQLPDGLDSHFSARAKASVVRTIYDFSKRPLRGLPDELQQIIDDPPSSTAWLSQAHTLALIIAIVEAQGLEAEAERLWIRAAASQLFESPMYKVLMWAASPRMVFKSAKIRWSAFFRGSSLVSSVRPLEATVSLRAPPALFNPDLARIFEQVIFAAINYTRDEQAAATVALIHYSPGLIEYRGEW